MTSNMAPIDTNDRWLLKLSSVSPIVSFIRVARAAQSWIFRRIPIYPIDPAKSIKMTARLHAICQHYERFRAAATL